MASTPAPPPPDLDDYLEALGLPDDMATRTAAQTQAVTDLVAEYEQQLVHRRFMPGLVMAFIAVVEHALAAIEEDSLTEPFLDVFDREEFTASGQRVNTLNLLLDGEVVARLRPRYRAAEVVYMRDLRRYDYPNMAPHATQAWPQHEDILQALFEMSPDERRAVADAVWTSVLALPEYGRRSTADASPRPFAKVLTDFPRSAPGEPAGALLQGLAFAYYRADSPNVTIETGKVGAGSRRLGRIADVDGWNGEELVLSIEVKDEDLTDPDTPTLNSFLANLAEWPDATAIVVARSATQDVRDALEAVNVAVLTRADMHGAVSHWDIPKQRIAARELQYYLTRVQRHSGLIERYHEFLAAEGIEI